VNRRTKNLKSVLTQERERERQERERRRAEREQRMEVDGAIPTEEEEELPTCNDYPLL
jgi:INO80 complex subunit C